MTATMEAVKDSTTLSINQAAREHGVPDTGGSYQYICADIYEQKRRPHIFLSCQMNAGACCQVFLCSTALPSA